MGDSMQISEVMKKTELTRKAIYFYEEKGLLLPDKIPVGQVREYREYSEEDVIRLQLIARLRQLDFSLPDIKKILDGERVDIILHNHLKQQQKKVVELLLTVDKLGESLSKISPNANCEELSETLDTVISDDVAETLSYKLVLDSSENHTRRVAMLLYEAFLDKPLSTKEHWDTWYAILEKLEGCMTPELLDVYDEFYGELTPQQLQEDYALRRRLVCGYTNYGPMEENAKAEELVVELKALTANETVFMHWHDYFTKLALSNHASVMDYVRQLSDVYDDYESRFIHMVEHYFDPIMATAQGASLKRTIQEKMGGVDMFNFYGLIYFDFYNNTFRRVRYHEGPRTQSTERRSK